MTKKETPKKQERPETRVVKIDHPPEYIAKAIFAAGKPSAKSKKKKKQKDEL